MKHVSKILAVAIGFSLLSGCMEAPADTGSNGNHHHASAAKSGAATPSGYPSHLHLKVPSADGCSKTGGRAITKADIDGFIKQGYQGDADILTNVMNGDATQEMKDFASKCLGFKV